MSKTQDATSLPPPQAMRSMIQRVATGPELSKDLSEAEAEHGMGLILDGLADPVQAAIWLIALRMKRETPAENRGTLSAIRARTAFAEVDVPDLVDIADPYNGYNRTLPASPFLPAVLAACGLPAVSQGVLTLGPKFGITHHRVLAAAGVDTGLDAATAAARVVRDGWAYVDQARFCAPLHDLVDLRTRMVKRPVITTVEVLAGPLRASGRTHLVTGYVHKPYPPVYSMLARHAGFDSCLLVRGVEGGIVPSLRQAGNAVRYTGEGEDQAVALGPDELGIASSLRAAPFPDDLPAARADDGLGMAVDADAAARAAADAGLAALAGGEGAARDGLVYAGAIALWHCARVETLAEGAARVREALDGGAARERFDAARSG